MRFKTRKKIVSMRQAEFDCGISHDRLIKLIQLEGYENCEFVVKRPNVRGTVYIDEEKLEKYLFRTCVVI